MPPFGESKSLLLPRSSSFLKEEALNCVIEKHGVAHKDLEAVLDRLGEASSVADPVIARIKETFEHAFSIRKKLVQQEQEQSSEITRRAVDHSVGRALLTVLDHLAVLFESEGEMKSLVSTLIMSTIERSTQLLNKLDSVVDDPPNDQLEGCLRQILSWDAFGDNQQVYVSLLSPSLAFEVSAGENHMRDLQASSSSPDSLPLRVNVSPFLLVRADDVETSSHHNISRYEECKVNVEFCSHTRLFSSERSKVLGEAVVRVYISPAKEAKSGQKGFAWGQGADVEKLRVAEIRA